MAEPNVQAIIRSDMLDFPSAWAIQDLIGCDSPPHHERCSAVISRAYLCDCSAVPDYWNAHYKATLP